MPFVAAEFVTSARCEQYENGKTYTKSGALVICKSFRCSMLRVWHMLCIKGCAQRFVVAELEFESFDHVV